MGAPGLTTPLRSETFENLQLNAGIFIKNLDYSSIADATALKTAIAAAIVAGTNILGATRGGGTFVVTREIREPEIDGRRYSFKGGKYVDSADAKLTTTLVELTPSNLVMALGGATATANGKKTTIKMHTAIQDSDYISSLTWFGDLADGRIVAITLKNALNTADLSLTFTDKGEATLPIELHAHQENVLDYDEAPFEIVFFEPSGNVGSITVTSSAGANVGGTTLSTTNSLEAGQHYVYKIGNASTAPTIGYREEPDYTWTEWDGSSELAVGASSNGKKATVAVINSSKKVLKTGTVVLAVKTA